MPGGKGNIRPSDGRQFSKDYQPNRPWSEEAALRLGNDLLNWMKAADENIFFDDFLYLQCNEDNYPGKIYPELLSYLAKKFTSFLNLLIKCREIEKIKLKKFGAFDKLNAGLVKFLLSADYGMTEKTQNENTNYNHEIIVEPPTIGSDED